MTSSTATNWKNWSGDTQVTGATVHRPQTIAELQTLVTSSHDTLRPVGSGHSWTALVPSHHIISLEHFSSVGRVDDTGCVWIGAGAPLHQISPDLALQYYAFRNLGDINVQTLAGATATATHGSGASLPCLSADIKGVKLVTASGDHITISADENSSWLPAAQVSLGTLGIITDIAMQLVPHYRLHRRVWFAPLKDIRDQATHLWNTHRNFEFFYIPFSGHCMAISHDITDAMDTPRGHDESDAAVAQLKFIRDWTRWWPWLRRILLSKAIANAPGEEVVGESHCLLASERNTLFNEMEYHLPAAHGLSCLDEIINLLERRHSSLYFPIEVRQTASDPALLSPFQDGPRISIAVHCGAGDDYRAVLSDIEPIFKRYRGRPHWGKLNSATQAELRTLYPHFDTFNEIRKTLDPTGRFLNPHLQSLFNA